MAATLETTRAAPGAAPVATHFPFIDGLRAVAVLAVIAYHVNADVLPGGFVGVDMFFVVSGFVVSGSVVGFAERRPVSFGFRFAARRVRRILPALVVCLSVTQVLALVLIPTAGAGDGSEEVGLRALLGISNRLLSVGTDYFSVDTDFNPFTHTWSLGVEEQFYVAFPLVFLAWLRGGVWRRVSVAIVSATLVYSLLHARELTLDGSGSFAFYATSTRLWQIAAGVALYQFASRGGRDPSQGIVAPRWRGALLAASSALLVAALVGARPGHVPWPDGLLPALGTAGLVASLAEREWAPLIGRVLSSRALVAVGLLSYSLYLWHWPVLVLFRWTVGLESVGFVVVALVLIAGLATGSYFLVERPVRRGRWISRRAPWLVVASAVAVVGGTYVVTSEAIERRPSLSASVVVQDREEWAPGGGGGVAPGACSLTSRLDPVAKSASAWVLERAGCANPVASRLFVVGDSHAGAFGEMLRQYTLDTGSAVHLIGNNGCGFGLIAVDTARSDACGSATRGILAYLAQHAVAGDVLFLPSLRLARLSETYRRVDVAETLLSPVSFRNVTPQSVSHTRELLQPLADRGIRLLFPAPLPLFAAPPYRCSDWFNRMNPICEPRLVMSRSVLERYRSPVIAAIRQLETTVPLQLWDPLPELCDAARCHAFRDGKPLFFDGDHLTGPGNRALVPSFEAAMARLTATAPSRTSAG